MTSESMAGSLPASPGSRPRTLGAQRLANRIVLGLLATPGVSRGIGKRLVTLYVVGRKSGKRYIIPVAYTRREGALLIGTGFGWGRNLRTGEPVEIRFLGRKRTADVQVLTSEGDVTAAYDIMSGPQISRSVGRLMTCTWPQRWPELLPRSRYQRPPGHGSIFIGNGLPPGICPSGPSSSSMASKAMSIGAEISISLPISKDSTDCRSLVSVFMIVLSEV